MSSWPIYINPADFAPGDQQIHPNFPSGTRLHTVESIADPMFERIFDALFEQFGAAREMETKEVLESRFHWQGDIVKDHKHMAYFLQAIMKDDEIVGIRDHTVIADPTGSCIVVHMSHVLVPLVWRRKGVVSALRTLPVSDARNMAKSIGKPDAPIVLFCEMDPIDLTDPPNRIRRLSYKKAGYRGIPGGHGYMQPDFSDPATIEQSGVTSQPVVLDLLFRFINFGSQSFLSRELLIESIENVYSMYAEGMTAEHMQPCYTWLNEFKQTAKAQYPLVLPTETS